MEREIWVAFSPEGSALGAFNHHDQLEQFITDSDSHNLGDVDATTTTFYEEGSRHGYELIVGTNEDDDALAVAIAVSLVKDRLPGADILDAAIYDGGGVGVDIATDRGGLAESFYGGGGGPLAGFSRLESVEHFPVFDTE